MVALLTIFPGHRHRATRHLAPADQSIQVRTEGGPCASSPPTPPSTPFSFSLKTPPGWPGQTIRHPTHRSAFRSKSAGVRSIRFSFLPRHGLRYAGSLSLLPPFHNSRHLLLPDHSDPQLNFPDRFVAQST